MTTKRLADYATDAAVIVFPVILGAQVQIMGLIPPEEAAIIVGVGILFGILSAVTAKLRRNEKADDAVAQALDEAGVAAAQNEPI